MKHCYREANAVADALARFGATMDNDFVVFNSPAYVLMLLYQDASNFVYLRHCHSSANPVLLV